MRKRIWFALLGAVVLVVGAALAFPVSHFAVLGWLRGEAFYRGKPTSYWQAALRGDRFIDERGVGNTLREGGDAAVPVLVEMLGENDPHTQAIVLIYLNDLGEDARNALPALADHVLKTSDPFQVEETLKIIGHLDESLARRLVCQLIDSQSYTKKRVLGVLSAGPFCAADSEILGKVSALLDDPNPSVREAAAVTLLRAQRRDLRIPRIFLASLQAADDRSESAAGTPSLSSFAVTSVYHNEVIRELFHLLKSPDATTRKLASEALRDAWLCETDVSDVLAAVRSGDPEVSRIALSVLQHFGNSAKAALPVLISQLKSKDSMARKLAADNLTALGSTEAAEVVPVLRQALADPDFNVRCAVMRALVRLAPDAATAQQFQAAFEKADIAERRYILAAVAGESKVADESLEMLTEALDSPEADLRTGAARALFRLKPQGGAALARLLQMLQEETDPVTRSAVIMTLAAIGPAAREAAPLLLKDLQKESSEDPVPTAVALLSIDPGEKQALDKLSEMLSSSTTFAALHLRERTLNTLAAVGKSADAAVPVLRRYLDDDSCTFRPHIVITLAYLGVREKWLIETASKMAEAENMAVLNAACVTFEIMGNEGQALVPALTRRMTGRVDESALMIGGALLHVDPKNAAALETLTACIQSEKNDVRLAAAFAISRLGPVGRPLEPALIVAAKKEKDVKTASTMHLALANITGDSGGARMNFTAKPP